MTTSKGGPDGCNEKRGAWASGHGFSIGFHVAKAITTNKPTIWGWFKCIYMHL